MTVIAKQTGVNVHLIDDTMNERYSVVVTEAVTNGQVGYVLSTGKYGVADANAAGKQQARGLFIEAAGANGGSTLLKRGRVGGFDLSALAYDALVYLSDTAGALDTAAGTMSVTIGRVVPMSDSDYTKVLYVDCSWITTWA